MQIFTLTVPLLFLALFIFALCKKVKLYDCFAKGVGQAIPLITSLFPFLATILIMSELFEQSGLSGYFAQAISPVLEFFHIPKEIGKLILLKPFSGSGSTALLAEIYQLYGADSHIARCASVCYGSSETVFFLSAVYFTSIRQKKIIKPILIALFVNFITVILGCKICDFM